MAVKNAAIALAACICCTALCAAQPSIDLHFRDGRVWIVATDVPVRDILREWARVSGATIINGEVVEGPPVTLQLTGVSEVEALDTVLRDTAGYIAVLRAAGAEGPSRLKRIVILPMTSVVNAPAATASPRAPTLIDDPDTDLPQPLADIIRTIRDSMPSASPPPSDHP